MNQDIKEDLAKKCILGHDENNRLAILAKQGDAEAKEKLLAHNYRLISKLANKYKTSNYTEDDLFQDGIIGMINALATYDETKASFTTHAFSWICSEMRDKTAKNNSDFHYNSAFYDKLRKYDKLVRSTKKSSFTEEELKQFNLTEKDVETVQKYKREACYSLDSLTENGTFASMDENSDLIFNEPIETLIINKELKNMINHEIQSRLKPLEQYVIINTFGINVPIRKLTDLALELGVSRQYVYKIKSIAMSKLKKSKDMNIFFNGEV
ncbi:sigma-70 family RNA polymerase sigma factor [Hungatella hathewayi]|uniref:sigma-70 family RNA polymerase sigma factor n=1 Tax=Hungatella hathewayi TaxID=154046 RepID=UPI003562C3C3